MPKIYALIEFLITVVLRCTANTRAVLNRFRLWRWLNTPMSESCAPVVRWWNAKAELANSDRNRYFMSARRRYGIFGYGLYTQYQPIVLTDEYNTEIEELMKFRYKHESSFFMGGRFEVMAYIKGLRNSDFDNAITMDEFRAARFTAYIDAFCADTMNHQSLFRHWLSVQVRKGSMTAIDGYIFTGPTKNCEIGAFLYKYFDTFETAHAVGLHQGYRSPEHLAQYLVKELQKAALGLTDGFEFECINTKLRDYTERNKASQIAVTDLGNDATPIEMVDAMIQAHIADRAKNILAEDDFIGVKPSSPWPHYYAETINDYVKPLDIDFDDHRKAPVVIHGPAEERLCNTFGITMPITDVLQRMSSKSFDVSTEEMVNEIIDTGSSKVTVSSLKHPIQVRNVADMPTEAQLVEKMNAFRSSKEAERNAVMSTKNFDGSTFDETKTIPIKVSERDIIDFKERNANSEGDVYVLGGDRILEIQNFQAITALAYGDVDVANPKLIDLSRAGVFCPSERTLMFRKSGYTEHNYIILKIIGRAVWKHLSTANVEVPSMCDRNVSSASNQPTRIPAWDIQGSALNITFTDASVVNLENSFDFTDVLSIFINGIRVNLGLSASVEAGLRSAGITFSEDKQTLYYTPVHNEVTSVVLQLKKTSDVEQKVMCEFTVVAYPMPSSNTRPSFKMDISPEIAPESLVDIQSLARSVSAASGRLDADKLSRS